MVKDDFEKLNVTELIEKVQKMYLLKNDKDESIYPSKCFRLSKKATGSKPINLSDKVKSHNELCVKLYDVWHLNICNEQQIWKAQSDHVSITHLKSVIQKDDLSKINHQFS